ncbi:trimeric intracellular cation channel family protein [Sediminicoccus sp. KRV36]|uniref:trimeric intracellular cation channel family protein n=1 Tax=Sediminicoccus sp. KRV36 TaxID=3133721 RepID=UPI002010BDF6|nr:trimeric intracellular cation channel family protein [Sediminicoccus rosea]UPY37629.1 trimeric intracellular cation channel family protein [Sediminicoccus rosea]
MTGFDAWLYWIDHAAIAVFAISGALVASRKQMDAVGFILIAIVTGFGGGTLRDLLLGRTPVFWLRAPELVGVAVVAAVVVFFTAHRFQNRFRALLWADAVGLSIYAVLGAEIALLAGAHAWAAVILGVITATFGGIARDVICNEIPLILRKEIYVTAAAAGATMFILLRLEGIWREPAFLAGALTCFAIRAAAIQLGWSLPGYRGRPGRDYPDRDG